MKSSVSLPRLGAKLNRKFIIKQNYSLCCTQPPPGEIEPNRTITVRTTIKTNSSLVKVSTKGKQQFLTEEHDQGIGEVQSSSTPFRFLDLPRRARNIIYQYTLQQESILSVAVASNSEEFSVHGKNFDCCNGRMRPVENVFELVCKQLREESRSVFQKRGREIGIYEKSSPLPSSYAFWTFVTEPTFHFMRDQVRTIYVKRCKSIRGSNIEESSVKEMFECIAEFKPFCEENPEINVIVRFARIAGVNPKMWYQWVATFQEFLRGSSRLTLPEPRRHVLPECSRSFDELRVLPFLPHNLRFSVVERYPEVEVEADLRHYRKRGQISKEEVVELKVWAQRIFDNGI